MLVHIERLTNVIVSRSQAARVLVTKNKMGVWIIESHVFYIRF